MKTCKEMAEMWGISERRVADLCKNGKIPGVKRNGRNWEIPDTARKPDDGRVVSGKYIRNDSLQDRKPLPVGISDYVRAQAEYYYVDKTLLIKEFLDRKVLVSLFTRPRRFGKTLNMDMLRVFFECAENDTSIYFKDKAIWECGDEYTRHQGQYPVIFLTFKDFLTLSNSKFFFSGMKKQNFSFISLTNLYSFELYNLYPFFFNNNLKYSVTSPPP